MAYPLHLPVSEPLLTVTHPTSAIWLIELHNGEDSRLTETLLRHGLNPALDVVEKHWREGWRAAKAAKDEKGAHGALIITGKRGQDKFFSNGFDYANASTDPNFFPLTVNPIFRRLLTFPIPTVAAINGHCFAAGMMLALCCDYRVMTDGSTRRAWMCMNEIHFGANWPLAFAAVLRTKVSDAIAHRKIALEGHRFTPAEALDAKLVDHLVRGDTEAIINKACEVATAVSPLSQSGAWGLIKTNLYRDTVEATARDVVLVGVPADDAAAKARL